VAGVTDIARALEVANRDVVDFQVIKMADPSAPRHRGDDVVRRRLCAEDTLAMHQVDREWLRRELEADWDGPTVVVTHHAPSRGSVATRFASDWCTPAFVSDLPHDFFGRASLWVHGHTHTAFDYQVDGCRVVSNPRGYRLRDSSFENGLFNPELVVEVTPELPRALAARANYLEHGNDGRSFEEVMAELEEHGRKGTERLRAEKARRAAAKKE
jgi:hypothetical protein